MVRRIHIAAAWILGALALALPWSAQAEDDDALALQSEPTPEKASLSGHPMRLFVEAAVGREQHRYQHRSIDTQRLSIDFNHGVQLGAGWRLSLSDRLDSTKAIDAGDRSTLNSLREANVSWQGDGGSSLVELGRINLRNGPAYGFNPTDYFRRGSLRTITTSDPLALRENRMGTVMLRAQHLWAGGALALALAPKLADHASQEPFSADLGATNASDRALATFSTRLSDAVSGQALLMLEKGQGPQLGVSATGLLSEAAVAHFEWSRGQAADPLAALSATPVTWQSRTQYATGLTYTTSQRLSLTLEYEFNGAAVDQRALAAALASSPDILERYLRAASDRQDSASRRAWLLYASQKSLIWRNLDLTGLVRRNADDHSRYAWIELRYHLTSADLALQWQRASGSVSSEYGSLPARQLVQVLGVWYF